MDKAGIPTFGKDYAETVRFEEKIKSLDAELAKERQRKRELELILENVMKVIKATLGD